MQEKKQHGGARVGAGRKPVAEYPLDIKTYCRVSKEEYKKMQAIAKSEDITVSVFIRNAILEKIK